MRAAKWRDRHEIERRSVNLNVALPPVAEQELLAVARDEASIPVVYVDLDEAEEAVVLAALDLGERLALAAVWDGR